MPKKKITRQYTKPTTPPASPEEFVTAWLNGSTVEKIAEALKTTANAVNQRVLSEVPTEFFEGEWHFPKADGPEPWAVITYTDKPSPETGHVGWCWWAMGSMGDAPTYEAARDSAVAEIQRRMDRRMAVL